MKKQLKKFKENKQLNVLPEAEQLIMAVIWENPEPMNVYQVQERIKQSFDIEWGPTTICTFIKRMEGRKFLKLKRSGKFTYYYPLISKEEYVKEVLQEFCEKFKLPTKAVIEMATKDI